MKRVMRGNRQLRIEDGRLDYFLRAGYVEVDEETGQPINLPVSDDDTIAALKAENEALKAENEALKAELAALTKGKKDKTQEVTADSSAKGVASQE